MLGLRARQTAASDADCFRIMYFGVSTSPDTNFGAALSHSAATLYGIPVELVVDFADVKMY